MKITQIAEKINLNQVMDISVDVHKDTLNFFFASAGREYTDICSNRTDVIQRRITKYKKIAKEHGMGNLRIICEPTGQYQNSLLRTARRNGCLTCYVNAESVKVRGLLRLMRVAGRAGCGTFLDILTSRTIYVTRDICHADQ